MNPPSPFSAAAAWATLCLLAACSDGTGPAPQPEAGTDAPATDAPSSDAPSSDSPATDAPTCASDAAKVACCCRGDVQANPTCGAGGTLTCAANFGLYHGADCSCSTGQGPCCIAGNTLDASDAADAPLTDGSVCVAPQVLRYETAGCGAAAHPVCGSRDQDACAAEVCGCDGATLLKCDYAAAPWAHLGPCADASTSEQ